MKIIDMHEFKKLIGDLIGRTINPFNGYGSYLMLETECHAICFEFHWRIEDESSIMLGWTNSRSYIETKLKKYVEKTIINDIRIEGSVRELVVELEKGKIIKSIASFAGYPNWYIKLSKSEYIHTHNGDVVLSDGSDIGSEFEVDDNERDIEIENRWSKQLPMKITDSEGCGICKYVVRLEACYPLRELALCANSLSDFDKSIVHYRNKCEQFIEKCK